MTRGVRTLHGSPTSVVGGWTQTECMRYFVRRTADGGTEGPFPNQDIASAYIARQLERSVACRPGDLTVVLDMFSIGILQEAELRTLLHTDPLLACIFKLGRQVGRTEAEGPRSRMAPDGSAGPPF